MNKSIVKFGSFLCVLCFGCINPTFTRSKLLIPPPSLDSNISNLKDNEIYSTDAKSLLGFMLKNKQEYHILVSYTYWCPLSKSSFSEFFQLDSCSDVRVYFITADDWYFINDYKYYLESKNYKSPSFILDIKKYGNKFNPHPRFRRFALDIDSTCRNLDGFPSYFVFNKELKLIYKRTGALDDSTRVIIGLK